MDYHVNICYDVSMKNFHENVPPLQDKEVRQLELYSNRKLEVEVTRRRGETDAHGFLRAVYNNEALPLHIRLDAAKTAIKYEKPALQAVATQYSDGREFAEKLEAARLRAGGRDINGPEAARLLTSPNPAPPDRVK